MTHAEVTQVPDIRGDERIPQAAYRPTFVRGLCMVPVGMPHPVGAIGLYWSQVGQRLADDALAAVQRLAAETETEQIVRRLDIDSAPWAPKAREQREHRGGTHVDASCRQRAVGARRGADVEVGQQLPLGGRPARDHPSPPGAAARPAAAHALGATRTASRQPPELVASS